jgi:hypothetical protein
MFHSTPAHQVTGYAIEGAFYCAEHAQIDAGDIDEGHATPVFAGDEGADEHTCDACSAERVIVLDSVEGPYRAPTYLDEALVLGRKLTATPSSGQTRQGYGGRLPTGWMLNIGGRWHRVRVMCWSNSGTAYVERGGKRLLLGSYDPAHDTTTPLTDARPQAL